MPDPVADVELVQEWAVRFHDPYIPAFSKSQQEPPSAGDLKWTRELFPRRVWVTRWVSPWREVEEQR